MKINGFEKDREQPHDRDIYQEIYRFVYDKLDNRGQDPETILSVTYIDRKTKSAMQYSTYEVSLGIKNLTAAILITDLDHYYLYLDNKIYYVLDQNAKVVGQYSLEKVAEISRNGLSDYEDYQALEILRGEDNDNQKTSR
ncbi:hypothetical protein GPK34_00395 [Secundilactobacillus kimchicus]|uniref:hypothetical protein n=1 Tax=Secundilactobacillus kimchicus TaxID=528209 RepID=UPI001C024EC0|nr:hypothetical protein [Secundilactobacillus kimchicus]MBT9670496.1 hypothetical protein [Secundilactobacillus kimchicus]